MMLSACGLNQPGTNSSDSSSNVANTEGTSQELPVIQEPVEAVNDQMQGMEQQDGSMEAKIEGDSDSIAKDKTTASDPAMENMEEGVKEPQDSTAEAEMPGGESATDVEEKKTDLKS
jgi:hypothetical protein